MQKGKRAGGIKLGSHIQLRELCERCVQLLAARLSLAMHGSSSAQSVLVTLPPDLRALLPCWIESALYNIADNDRNVAMSWWPERSFSRHAPLCALRLQLSAALYSLVQQNVFARP